MIPMKLKKFKERDNKRLGIIVFTIVCILLVSGAVLYRTFAIFEVKTNQNVINGSVQSMGDLEFAFYKDDEIVKEAPAKGTGYSLDTSSSYCVDLLNNQKISNVNWDNERWGPYLSNITTTKTKCYLHFKQIYKEEILNGADPDLMNGRLVPVIILSNEAPTDSTYQNGSSGKVEKADITNTSDPWYSYKNKKWANAVILKDGVVDNYKPGDEIEEKDIESYFVWIPRYKYQLKENESTYNEYTTATQQDNQDVSNIGANSPFKIEFETKESGNTQGSQQGDYLTHPAFVSFNSNGFWVGKFETGYNQNNENTNVMPTESWSMGGAQKNEESSSKIIIKPNVYSWRGIQVANAFYSVFEYQRDLDSHLIKNMEWGAVAYLTYSEYGRCKDNQCEEVRINNSKNYITGYSAKVEATLGNGQSPTDEPTLSQDGENGYSYYNFNSQVSSTTGNYYGVFDMSGGAWDYVMGVMQGTDDSSREPASGATSTNNSDFNGPYSYDNSNESKTNGKVWPSSKYYDLYDYDILNQGYQRGKLGDATKEMGPFYILSNKRPFSSWFLNSAASVNTGSPWFVRGGVSTSGSEAGVSSFRTHSGTSDNAISFRIVLTP